jgi:hypothetical protein
MSFIIKKASKQAKKLRILLSASSGSGKTKGALRLAKGLVKDWNKICVIDTERKSAALYADLGEYNIIELNAPYTPERFIEAITAAENAGMECIIIDSITHEWDGEGGCLEIHSKLGGTFQNWASVTPRHQKFVNKILTSSAHIICTVRRKEDYVISVGANGKNKVEKLGMKEVQRDGFSYEVDLTLEISNSNHLSLATKDRTGLFSDVPEFLITEETGEKLFNWCQSGRSELDDALEMIRNSSSEEELTNIYNNYQTLKENSDFIEALKNKKQNL